MEFQFSGTYIDYTYQCWILSTTPPRLCLGISNDEQHIDFTNNVLNLIVLPNPGLQSILGGGQAQQASCLSLLSVSLIFEDMHMSFPSLIFFI